MSESRDLQRGLVPAYDEERVAATWYRIAEARAGRRRTYRSWTGLALAATAAAAAIVFVVGQADDAGPLASVDPSVSLGEGARVDAETRTRAVTLDDGSRVELASGTSLQVLANAGDRFVTLLEHGAAHFTVKPYGPRRWEIETALATVEVVGTDFRVEHSDTRLVVEVVHGVVMVRGERVPGRVVRLIAGERLEVTAEPTQVAASVAPGSRLQAPGSEPAAVVVAPTVVSQPTSPRVPERDEGPSPGVQPVQGPGTWSLEPGASLTASLATALTSADDLRASGNASAAADLLDRALASDPHSPAAGLAAFTVGRLALDRLGQPDRAARAFARVIELGSPHALLEDAYARRAEALIRTGDRVAAEAALAEYERAYPDARRAPALRAQLQGE